MSEQIDGHHSPVLTSTTPLEPPPPSAIISRATAAVVDVGTILPDATTEDEYDDDVNRAEAALKTMRLGDPAATETSGCGRTSDTRAWCTSTGRAPTMRLVGDFVEKKKRLGLDFWAVADESAVDDEVYGPFIRGLRGMVERVVRECLVREYLGWEMAELFAGKTEAELEELAGSFALERCVTRDRLNELLRADAESTGDERL
ncbi:hypothetical protein BR93DRAFT_968964 [Coniochaeta sp. PMI_546]|nr:hypothetical protein BR93DRAFT_968964 [Coniochaeta sp. PMI_546]